MNFNIKSSTIIGVVTALILVLCHKFLFEKNNQLQWLQYLIYALGIGLAIFINYPTETKNQKFSFLFGEGFKCFIPIVLIMCINSYFLITEDRKKVLADEYRVSLEKVENKTPDEKEKMVKKMLKRIKILYVSTTQFSFVLIGAFFSLIFSGIILQYKKQLIQ